LSGREKSPYNFAGFYVPRKSNTPRRTRAAKRLPKAPRALQRFDVTRLEYNRIIGILNERALTLNEFRDAIQELRHTCDVQFKRIAQLQADLDAIKRAWERLQMVDR
jgi:hypothetical protein